MNVFLFCQRNANAEEMKILYISHVTVLSGSTIALLNIVKEMVLRGNKVGVVVPERKGWLFEYLQLLNVEILDIGEYYPWLLEKPKSKNFIDLIKKNYEYVKYIFRLHRKFYELVKCFRPDIVHCNNSTIDFALYACKKLNIPHVWHIREYHDLDFKFETFPSLSFLRWKMHTDNNYCIAITKGVFDHFKLRKTDCVIYDGVIDLDKANKLVPNNLGFQYFLFVGAIIRGKALHVVLEQFLEFHKCCPNIHLIITSTLDGNDDYSTYCSNVAKTGAFDDYIHFWGRRDDVYALMQNAIALLVPSYFEGFGFVTAEAMYNHCLVIGRNTAGTKEQFDNGLDQTGEEIGLRFDSDSELKTLMYRAITEDFSDMKNRAYNVVVNNYSTKICAEKILAFYRSIL